jgi:hypothetical protein
VKGGIKQIEMKYRVILELKCFEKTSKKLVRDIIVQASDLKYYFDEGKVVSIELIK